jgi:hypothetical protein
MKTDSRNIAAFLIEAMDKIGDDLLLPSPGVLAELVEKYKYDKAWKDLEWKHRQVLKTWMERWMIDE